MKLKFSHIVSTNLCQIIKNYNLKARGRKMQISTFVVCYVGNRCVLTDVTRIDWGDRAISAAITEPQRKLEVTKLARLPLYSAKANYDEISIRILCLDILQ